MSKEDLSKILLTEDYASWFRKETRDDKMFFFMSTSPSSVPGTKQKFNNCGLNEVFMEL